MLRDLVKTRHRTRWLVFAVLVVMYVVLASVAGGHTRAVRPGDPTPDFADPPTTIPQDAPGQYGDGSTEP
jgi:Cu/Ag efflux pump CusA